MNKITNTIILLILLILSTTAFAQSGDTRYDTSMNLPFNEKAGDVNPQTGSISLNYTDVALPGRAGFNFSFGRIWTLTQSNAFNMYFDGSNRLNSNTVEKVNRLGVGWSTSMPYIMENTDTQYSTLNLFYGGSVYEIDRTGIAAGDVPTRSNLLGYDLTNLRIFNDSSVSYAQFVGLAALKTKYPTLTDMAADTNIYTLVTKTNEKSYFRADGKLMMKQDRSGLNRIWYFYKGSELAVVVDTIGREIRFAYDLNGNLESISWDVTVGKKDPVTGVRSSVTETRTVSYGYLDAETTYTEVANLKPQVLDYRKPYMLSTVTDNMGNVTKYDYTPGLATFTYDSTNAHSENLYLMLSEIAEVYTAVDGKFKNKRCFEYEVPAEGMYTKYFFNGMTEYYKISRQYMVNKNGRIMNDTTYRYYDKNYNGNFNSYTAEITMDKLKTIYKYTLSDSSPSQNHVLDTLTLLNEDESFTEMKDYVYASDRTKVKEDTYRLGEMVYSENFQYDNKGNLKRHEDKVGLITRTTYDDKFSMPLTKTVTVTVNGIKEDYKSENVINALGQVEKQIVYLKGENGTKRAVTVSTIGYDIYGNPVTQTDAAGNTQYTVYDTTNNTFPVKIYQDVTISAWGTGTVHDNWQTESTGTKKVRIRSWKVFNSDGSVWLEIDNEGYAIEHYYDANGQEIETVNPDLDDDISFATPIEVVNGSPVGTDFVDFRDNPSYANFLLKRQNNPGVRMEIDYQNEFVKSFADIDVASGHVKITGQEADGLGNVLREIEYKGGVEFGVKSMEYDAYGRMIVLTDPDADLTTGTPITIDNNTYTRYDKSWVVKYDMLGRKVRVLYPVTRGKYDIKNIVYDDISNKVTTTDPEGLTLEESYDWNGNLIKVVRYGKNGYTPAEKVETYSFEYDELKRKTKFTDAMGLVTGYRYDERGLLVEQSYDKTGSDIMKYDDRGLLVSKTDRKNNRLEFNYDEMGRNLKASHFANNVYQYSTKLDYDNRGNAVRVNNGKLLEHYIYDYGNRVIKLERKLADTALMTKLSETVWAHTGATNIFSFNYKYNDAGMVTEMVYPDGSVHKYDYDSELSRLQKIHEAANPTAMDSQLISPSYKAFVDSFSYTTSGVITNMAYSNGTSQTWEFDNRKRISRISIAGVSENIADLKFTLNGNGDVDRINNHEYLYDGFNRIVYAKTQIPGTKDRQDLVKKHFGTYNNGLPVNGVLYNAEADIIEDGRINGYDHIMASFDRMGTVYDEEHFEYDKNGNRTKLVQNGDIYTYEYGARNRLEKIYIMRENEQVESLFGEYIYDANGNTIKRTLHTKEGLKVVEFEYDTMNRVVKTIEDGTKETSYSYDNAGNRLTKETAGEVTLYLRHGQIAVAMDIELNKDTTVAEAGKINRYILSGDLLAGRVTKEFTRDTATKVIAPPLVKKYWYHLDHLNSTKAVTKEDGTVDILYEYRAFGEQLKRLDGAGKNAKELKEDRAKYSYGGKELDDETNLYYFNARYYDATTGRFINVDPIQDGTNWYVYCNNNPLNRVDPTGLSDKEIENSHTYLTNGTIFTNDKPEDYFMTEDGNFDSHESADEIGKALGGEGTFIGWSGKNNKGARRDAAKEIFDRIKEANHSKDTTINLVGHSHGGNVMIMVANMLEKDGFKVNLFTFETPVRENRIRIGSTVNHTQFYSPKDSVQALGGEFDLKSFTWKLGLKEFSFANNIDTTKLTESYGGKNSPIYKSIVKNSSGFAPNPYHQMSRSVQYMKEALRR